MELRAVFQVVYYAMSDNCPPTLDLEDCLETRQGLTWIAWILSNKQPIYPRQTECTPTDSVFGL
jgi:hypothetical protein